MRIMEKDKRIKIYQVISLVFVIGLTVALLLNADKVKQLGAYGYPGIFLVSLLGNATLILPVPGIFVTAAMGAVFNPFWVAIVAGLGAGLGELTGYMTGFSGRAVVDKRGWHERLVGWMRKYGDVTILVLAFIPNPLFDVAGIIAGALKLPLWRYLLWSCLGKILKMLMFSYAGAWFANGIRGF